MDNPVAFGQEHAEEIGQLLDVANLSLLPFADAKPDLEKALAASHPLQRYWALTACSCFGRRAETLVPIAKKLLADENLMVRLRAAEFLGIVGEINPQPVLTEILNETKSHVEATIVLGSVVYFRDYAPPKYPFDASQLKMEVKSDGVNRRLEYLTGKL